MAEDTAKNQPWRGSRGQSGVELCLRSPWLIPSRSTLLGKPNGVSVWQNWFGHPVVYANAFFGYWWTENQDVGMTLAMPPDREPEGAFRGVTTAFGDFRPSERPSRGWALVWAPAALLTHSGLFWPLKCLSEQLGHGG